MKTRYMVAIGIVAVAGVMVGCSDSHTPVSLRTETDRPVRGAALSESTAAAGAVEVRTFNGELAYGGPEWELITGDGTYLLGMGNPAYLESTGVGLNDGDQVTVTGEYDGEEIAVHELTRGDDHIVFRTDAGVSMWAGSSSARGRRGSLVSQPSDQASGAGSVAQPGSGRGRGAGGAGRSEA